MMIRIYPGDIVAVKAGVEYYYAFILDKVKLFGGRWSFVLHYHSTGPREPSEIITGGGEGFFAFVDYYRAGIEERLLRLAKKQDFDHLPAVKYLKTCHETAGKAKRWFIYDMNFNEVKTVWWLSKKQKRYPLFRCIDDTLMVDLIERKWTPEQDPRI